MTEVVIVPVRHLVIPGLPPLHAFRVLFRADANGVLPPVPTTALHGALGRALYDEVCVHRERLECAGCPALEECAYSALVDPRRPAGAGDRGSGLPRGINADLPRPLILAPADPMPLPGGRPIAVSAGEAIAFRLVLVGRAVRHIETMGAAMHRVGAMGIGERVGRPGHVPMTFDGLAEVLPPPDTGVPERVRLELVTPARLKHAKAIAADLDAGALVSNLVRRAKALAALYGDPWEPDFVSREVAEALRIRSDVAPAEVPRYSHRQKRAMRWEAIIGHATIEGPGLSKLWSLLRFGEWAQIGKGTTFGLGQYVLCEA